VPCGVLMAPIIPFLSDDDDSLEATVKAIADSGATHVSPIALHLRKGGSREWWMRWVRELRPDLVPRYEELYAGRAYTPKAYQEEVAEKVHRLARKHGVGRRNPAAARRIGEPPRPPEQLSLIRAPEAPRVKAPSP
jgi:DNA repair photolyase